MKLFVFVICLLALMHQARAVYNAEATNKLLDILGDKHQYRKQVRPGLPPGPNDGVNALEVKVNMYMRSFIDMDMKHARMETQVTLRQGWFDTRLSEVCGSAGDNSTGTACAQLVGEDVDMIWRPDTFIRNELESKVHQNLARNNYVRVFPGGWILYSVRITLSTLCQGAAAKYNGFNVAPNIEQFNSVLIGRDWQQQHKNETFDCGVQIASYGYNRDNIKYSWKEIDPVQVTNSISLPNHVFSAFTTDYCDVITSTGTYSCLNARFAFTDVSDRSKFHKK